MLLAVGCVKFFQYLSSDLLIYKRHWGLSLPLKLEEKFSAADTGFTGDGDRYTIFIVKEIPDGYLSDFSEEKDQNIEMYVNEIADELNLEQKHRPDFSKSYRWKRYLENLRDGIDNTLVVLYSDDKFYFVEKII